MRLKIENKLQFGTYFKTISFGMQLKGGINIYIYVQANRYEHCANESRFNISREKCCVPGKKD